LYSNINIDVSGLTPEGYSSGDFQYRIFRGTVWFRYGTISGTLVATEQQNRFYRVAVAVYSAGADMDTDTPLFTLDASKLD
jgi:hypothetical protein